MHKNYRGKMFCFSPPVMLATFIIEFSFAIYTIWRYKLTTLTRLIAVILFALGTFQLSEYLICGGLGLSHIDWARIGYSAITILPAVGIHIIVTLANKKMPLLVGAAYATCAAFVVFYLFNTSSVTHEACYANYAVFSNHHGSGLPFGIYYYGWMIIGTWLAWHWSKTISKRKVALRSMTLGYIAFIAPTTFFNIIDPSTVRGIPSIMCGFAVLLAFTLILKVLPNSADKRVATNSQAKASGSAPKA